MKKDKFEFHYVIGRHSNGDEIPVGIHPLEEKQGELFYAKTIADSLRLYSAEDAAKFLNLVSRNMPKTRDMTGFFAIRKY